MVRRNLFPRLSRKFFLDGKSSAVAETPHQAETFQKISKLATKAVM